MAGNAKLSINQALDFEPHTSKADLRMMCGVFDSAGTFDDLPFSKTDRVSERTRFSERTRALSGP